MAKSHEYSTPNLFLDNFAALEKSFRPAGDCFADTQAPRNAFTTSRTAALNLFLSRCRLVALLGSAALAIEGPVPGVKRTSRSRVPTSEFD
ncbi:hypothetical protein [Bradyrhizobium sp. JR3.5]